MLPKVKFFIIPHNLYKGEYQHESIALAEGFRELGLVFYGTTNYWLIPDENSFLIQQSPEHFEADIHIYNQNYFVCYPEEAARVDYSKINVLIDVEDGLYSSYCDKRYARFNLILKAHYCKSIDYAYYHKNVQPWAFGLTNRIIQQIDLTRGAEVKKRAFVNFRINHSLRALAVKRFSPKLSEGYEIFNYMTDTTVPFEERHSEKDNSYWRQTNHRHDPRYYELLNESLFTYSFGGYSEIRPFATNRLNRQFQKFFLLKAAIQARLSLDTSRNYFIHQFDSWRFWESLYSQTCPIHMDFADWGFVLPVMPVNKVHYWGVERFNFEVSATELLKLEEGEIAKMAAQGRNWAISNYSPIAVANRLIDCIRHL